MCASGQFAATKGTCSRAKSHAPPTAAMVTTIWTQKRFDTLWLSKIWWISGTSSPAMWNVFRSISRAALATFRMLTPHALSRSFGLRLLLNAMNEKEAMTETEMRYSRTKRLDGCWWGCIVRERAPCAVHLPPQVSARLPAHLALHLARSSVDFADFAPSPSPQIQAHASMPMARRRARGRDCPERHAAWPEEATCVHASLLKTRKIAFQVCAAVSSQT